ncbi:MAG TPA: ATP-binding protein, partial [Candidatus Eisenbacteria bacterium]|nr:ATP-binding protein [Candidatus Eisenbacteria bacterium]
NVLLSVRDTGTGIPASELPHVFERFRRVQGAEGRTHEGTGIGLALVQELVKLHGGEVAVRSEEGRGTTFTVRVPHGASHLPEERIQAARRLEPTGVGARPFIEEALRWLPDAEPVSEAETSAVLALALPAFVGSAGATLRVLVADDNADMRDYLHRLLAGTYEVEVVADGQAALESVRAAPPDLVLADVMMPRLDGFGLLAAIREDPLTRSVPVLLLSARAGEESRIEGLAAGADAYMVKPFSARELLARVASLLELAHVRAETEQALRRHNRAKDEFLAMLGHELRNPIGALASAVHVFEHADRSPEEDARARAAMLRQVRHLGRLVDDLLDASRVTAAKIHLDREPVDLSGAVRNALETLRIAGALDRHTIEVQSESAWVDGDETRLEQIVANLVGNAVKFTPSGGRVSVTVRNRDDSVVLEVADNGSGIEPEALANIFELFEQGARTLDRRQGGLGIGLTLVQRLVELHGGMVRAESDGIGKGSTFTVSLPAIPPPPSQGGPRQDGGSTVEVFEVSVHPLGRRVLVIEDHEDAREMLRAMLELDGHEVHAAGNGKEGIDAALRVRPEVVLIDVGLPELDGYEVARALRANPDAQGLYLVALTGYGQPEDRERAKEAGFDEHVVKPIDPDRLSAILTVATTRAQV